MSALIQTSFANEATSYWATEDQFITLSQAIANLSSDAQNWSTYPAVSAIDASFNMIKNVSSLQIDAQVLTANASELFLNNVPIATISDISNVSDWALYPSLANIDANNFAISNVSGFELDGNQVSTLGNTILINGLNPTSNWSAYQANHNVDMAGYTISGTPSISISGNTQDVTLTASGTQLLVDGQPVFTGALPPSDTSNWANFPAIANVDMSGFNISNTPSISISGTTQNVVLTAAATALLVDGQPVYTGALPPSTTPDWALYPAVANVNMSGHNILGYGNLGIIADDISLTPAGSCNIYLNGNTKAKNIDITQGHINQCNVVGDGTTNTLVAATTFGDGADLGYVEILGANRVAGFSSFVVEGGVSFDGGTVHGFRATSATIPIPIFGFGSARFELTPLLTAMVSVGPCYIASGTFTAIQALLNARLEAGTFVTITHGNLGGFDGIYLQNTLNNGSNTRVIMTAGGTIYNIGNTQTSNLFTPQPIQFWSNVYNPSGGSAPVPPSVGIYPKNPIVYNDVSRNNNLLGNYVGWFGANGAYETSPLTTYASLSTFSGTTLIGNFPSVQNTTGITPYNYGSSSVHIGQQTISADFATTPPTLGDRAVAIGTISGWTGTGTADNIILGTHLNGITAQSSNCIAIGVDTGMTGQGQSAIAIGQNAGQTGQLSNSIAIGALAGNLSQQQNSVAVGYNAGNANQNRGCVAVGVSCANISQGFRATAVGVMCGSSNQSTYGVAVGAYAGESNQSQYAVAVGAFAGNVLQGANAVSVGNSAGCYNQVSNAVAVGYNAGFRDQSGDTVAVGAFAGYSNQSLRAVAIGAGAGSQSQSVDSIAIGTAAGGSNQGIGSVAVGQNAGSTTQGSNSVAIGNSAGSNSQANESVAIGVVAGNTNQQIHAIAIGANAGQFSQSERGVAVGFYAGHASQGYASTGLGVGAGYSNQGSNSVAVGYNSGNVNLGTNSIAIGSFASSNGGSFSNTIVLNATGGALDPAQASSTYIAPLREVQNSNAYQNSLMTYNATTKEVGYATDAYSLQVVATSGTAINLLPTLRGKTFILTGTTTQNFTTTSLTANDAGFFVIARNGNPQAGGGGGGNDITITGATGNLTIHQPSGSTNAGQVYLVWNGTGLVSY